MVREGSHAAHERFWREASTMSEAEKAATGDWYLFKPEVVILLSSMRRRCNVIWIFGDC